MHLKTAINHYFCEVIRAKQQERGVREIQDRIQPGQAACESWQPFTSLQFVEPQRPTELRALRCAS